MGYDLIARNKSADTFHFGAFSFPVLLEACGYLFPCIHNGSRWYCVFGVDPRMPKSDKYPRVLSNDGFKVTAEEAKIMARIARNYVEIQHSLPDSNETQDMRSKSVFAKDDVEKLMNAMHGNKDEPWPVKIRTDFAAKFAEFAEWAEKSGGFEIH